MLQPTVDLPDGFNRMIPSKLFPGGSLGHLCFCHPYVCPAVWGCILRGIGSGTDCNSMFRVSGVHCVLPLALSGTHFTHSHTRPGSSSEQGSHRACIPHVLEVGLGTAYYFVLWYLFEYRCHGLSVYPFWVCTGQSSHSARASAEWQSSAVTPQFNLSFSFVSRFSKHLIEFIAIDS